MEEYKIHYHHAKTTFGHFYTEFEGTLPQGETQRFFGKTSEHTSPIDVGIIRNENDLTKEDNHNKLKKKNQVITATQTVTQEQFLSVYNEAKAKSGGIYHATVDNCILFDQEIYEAGGGKGHFINLFNQEDLLRADTLASKHSMQYYENDKMRMVNGLNEQEVSKRFGVSIDRVVERGKEDLYGRSTDVTKNFVILPEKADHNAKYDISNPSNYKDYTHLEFTVANDLNTIFEAQDRSNIVNIQNLDLLRNNPGNWWKSSSTNNNNNNGPTFKFNNPFDGGQGPGNNPSPSGNGPSSSGGGGGWGSFYQAASDFFRMGTAKPVSPFIQAAQDYKPAYKELYETAAKDSKTSSFKIEEPAWLYVGKKPDNYDKAKTEFKREVEHCLSSTYCTTSISDIASKVARGYFGVDSPSLVRTQTQNTGGYVGERGWDPVMGVWVHALRKELGYAASHVSPLVLDLNGDGIKLYPYTKGVYFDIDNDGFAEKVGWLSENDGQLARDLNRNGQIDDITELFGDDLIFIYYNNQQYSSMRALTLAA